MLGKLASQVTLTRTKKIVGDVANIYHTYISRSNNKEAATMSQYMSSVINPNAAESRMTGGLLMAAVAHFAVSYLTAWIPMIVASAGAYYGFSLSDALTADLTTRLFYSMIGAGVSVLLFSGMSSLVITAGVTLVAFYTGHEKTFVFWRSPEVEKNISNASSNLIVPTVESSGSSHEKDEQSCLPYLLNFSFLGNQNSKLPEQSVSIKNTAR